MGEDEGHFLGLFIHWFSTRGSAVQKLLIGDAVASHPSGFLLLQSVRAHLLHLSLAFGENLSMGKPQQRAWREFISGSRPQLPQFHILILSQMFSPRNSLTYTNSHCSVCEPRMFHTPEPWSHEQPNPLWSSTSSHTSEGLLILGHGVSLMVYSLHSGASSWSFCLLVPLNSKFCSLSCHSFLL